MKKHKKLIIIIAALVVLITGITFAVYKIFKDENSLTISEKTWIDSQKNNLYSIYVPNDINVFGKNGSGVYFDFINDLKEDLNLSLNGIVYSSDSKNNSFGFNVGTNYDTNDLLIFTDYYVVLSKNNKTLNDINDINSKKIGVISKDLNYISSYYQIGGTITSKENKDELVKALDEGEVDYLIVPLNEYKDIIINKSYIVNYFMNDAKIYYYIHLGNDKTLNSIITKYYNKWIKEKFDVSYNRNNYNLFINSLGISDIDEDKLTDEDYTLAYLVNNPYSFISKGHFSGIVSKYLELFSNFSNIELDYLREKNFKDFKYDISKKKVDLYFNQYNYDNDYANININFKIDYYLIANRDVSLNIDSLKAYNDEIYVEENSILYNYLKGLNNITIKTYKKYSNIKNLLKKNKLILVDKLSYDNFLKDNLSNVDIKLSDTIENSTYSFRYKNNTDTFYKLFSSYINTLNPKVVTSEGLKEYFEHYAAGNRTVILARYIIILIIVLVIGVYLFGKSKKRIVLNTKVKNNEKIRYVDMLTSLKNRNYYNDRLEIWNQNTVYPQCVIVLDLNNIKYLNDTFGHEEGDKQIKATANILFKTQLENTEIIRTDGNEFMIYLVGYTEKQVISYIKKLVKEFNKLPYEYGAAIGFSMIKDDLKLVEDAFNEATIQMRKNKTTFEESSGEE